MTTVAGLVLAAGAGRRMGMPKALMRDPDGTAWLGRAVDVLREGGCATVTVVLGACEGRAAALAPGAAITHCPDWAKGVGVSLAHGIREIARIDEGTPPEALLVHLVDLPDVTSAVARRLIWSSPGQAPGAQLLRRAVYHGVVGHPVLIGRDHWAALADELAGDHGANAYLHRHHATEIECGDLATGMDVDTPTG